MAEYTTTPKYKIILLGNSGVGKTSCFLRLMNNNFHDRLEDFPELIHPVESWEYTVVVDGVRIEVIQGAIYVNIIIRKIMQKVYDQEYEDWGTTFLCSKSVILLSHIIVRDYSWHATAECS